MILISSAQMSSKNTFGYPWLTSLLQSKAMQNTGAPRKLLAKYGQKTPFALSFFYLMAILQAVSLRTNIQVI